MTTAELLEAWRGATRAAEVAQHLGEAATETAAKADIDANVPEEVATLAEARRCDAD